MQASRTGSALAALLAAASVAFAACASSSNSSAAGEELPEGRAAMGTMRIDALTSQFDIQYIEDVAPISDTVSAIVEEVWNLVPQAYVDLGIPIDGVNPQARLLGNTSFRARGELGGVRISKLLNCGRTMTGDIANQYDIYFQVVTQVKEADGKSVVSSVVDASARPTGVSGNAVQCSSRGRLEQEILTRIRARLVGLE